MVNDDSSRSSPHLLQIPSEIISDEIFAKYLEFQFVISSCSLVCKKWFECSVNCKLEVDMGRQYDEESFLKCCKSERLKYLVGFTSSYNLAFVDFVKYGVSKEDGFGVLKNLNLIYAFEECCALVSSFKNLKRLAITSGGIEVGEWIGDLVQLTYLDLYENLVNWETCKYIQKCELITELDLSNNEVKDTGCLYLSSLKNLTVLKVENNGITEKGVEYISQIGTLKTLDISKNWFSDEGFLKICTLRNLTELNASSCVISSVSNLANLGGLIQLNLNGNSINNEGIKIIAELTNLKVLGLANNQFLQNAVQYLTKLIHLDELDLRDNNLSFDDVDCLKCLKKLKDLKIITRHQSYYNF